METEFLKPLLWACGIFTVNIRARVRVGFPVHSGLWDFMFPRFPKQAFLMCVIGHLTHSSQGRVRIKWNEESKSGWPNVCPVRSKKEVTLPIPVSTTPHCHPASKRGVSAGSCLLSPLRALPGLLTGWVTELMLLDSILVWLLWLLQRRLKRGLCTQ